MSKAKINQGNVMKKQRFSYIGARSALVIFTAFISYVVLRLICAKVAR
jgi:hypothetical protein